MIIFILLAVLFLTPIILAFILLVIIYKYEDLEKQLEREISAKNIHATNLYDAEERITQRNKLIEKQEKQIKKLKNKLTIIEAYITSNNYGNAEIQIRKLKEIIRNYQKEGD